MSTTSQQPANLDITPWGDNFALVIQVDHAIHTPEHPQCLDRTCPCHETDNQDSITLQLPVIFALGKGAISLEREDEDTIQEFLNGMTIGNLAYHAYTSKARVTATDVTLMIIKRLNARDTSPFLNYGVIVGFLATLIQKANLPPTSYAFNQGRFSGQEAYCQIRNRLLPLQELCTLIAEKHGKNSASHAGYVYGFIEAFTKNIRVVKPRIPGEE